MGRINNKKRKISNNFKNNDDTISIGFYNKKEGKMEFEDVFNEDVEKRLETYMESNPGMGMSFEDCEKFFKNMKS